MTDRNIPIICRDCRFCHRYHEIGELTLYDWTPWKYECRAPYGGRPSYTDEFCTAKEAK